MVSGGRVSVLPWNRSKRSAAEVDKTFGEQASQLEQRIAIVQQGLIRTGVRTVQLGTEEAIELLYKMFNPGEEGKPMPLNSEPGIGNRQSYEIQKTQSCFYSCLLPIAFCLIPMAFFDLFSKKSNVPAARVLPVLPEEIYETGVLDLQDVIAPHALKVNSRELDLGEKIARTFFVISYPRFLTTGWFAPIINMDKVLDIAIFIHPMDTNEMLRKFQKKVAEVHSQISTREQKGMVRDPMLDIAFCLLPVHYSTASVFLLLRG